MSVSDCGATQTLCSEPMQHGRNLPCVMLVLQPSTDTADIPALVSRGGCTTQPECYCVTGAHMLLVHTGKPGTHSHCLHQGRQ